MASYITRPRTETLATVDVDDEGNVELITRRGRVTLTPHEASELALMLAHAANEGHAYQENEGDAE